MSKAKAHRTDFFSIQNVKLQNRSNRHVFGHEFTLTSLLRKEEEEKTSIFIVVQCDQIGRFIGLWATF